MLGLPSSVRIYLAIEAVDMRNGFNGLAALVEKQNADVYSGHLFVFLSKRRDRAKILVWDRGGFVLWCKRLEQGRFRLPPIDVQKLHLELDSVQLAMLLDGVDIKNVRRGRFWQPPLKKSA